MPSGRSPTSLTEHPGQPSSSGVVLAGWLMGLLSWLVAAGRDTISQIVLVWLGNDGHRLCELASRDRGPPKSWLAVFSGQGIRVADFGRFVLWATLGNALGARSSSRCEVRSLPAGGTDPVTRALQPGGAGYFLGMEGLGSNRGPQPTHFLPRRRPEAINIERLPELGTCWCCESRSCSPASNGHTRVLLRSSTCWPSIKATPCR